MPKIAITIDETKCILCLDCVEVCPREVFDFDYEAKKVIVVNEKECIICKQCLELCSTGAVSIEGALEWKPKHMPPYARKERALGYYPVYQKI